MNRAQTSHLNRAVTGLDRWFTARVCFLATLKSVWSVLR